MKWAVTFKHSIQMVFILTIYKFSSGFFFIFLLIFLFSLLLLLLFFLPPFLLTSFLGGVPVGAPTSTGDFVCVCDTKKESYRG